MGQTYVEIAILTIAIIVYFLYLAWEIKKRGLKETVVTLIVRAEDMYNKGDNRKKMNFVIGEVLKLIPAPFSLFITEQLVQDFIQLTFDEVKKALDYVPRKEM